MTGITRLEKVFKDTSGVKLMTHVVGGFPDIQTSKKLIIEMANSGSDIIEVQLPFSDPIADGPVILAANYMALKNDVRTSDVLSMLEEVRKEIETPLLVMSYMNPLFAYGFERFFDKMVSIGLDGVIIPDSPPEEKDDDLAALCDERDLAYVPLIAPTIGDKRIGQVAAVSKSPFVYAVLRLGVTGKATNLEDDLLDYIDTIRKLTGKYIAAGFGIKDKSQLEKLKGHADCGVIGSAVIRLINKSIEEKHDPVKAVGEYIRELTS
ncbi:MAG: tryptophan synthase subunit alpha [Spirochaetes bacterium]|nr:tryptophan synthase subunit alpha [Spirochaetota bacterium]